VLYRTWSFKSKASETRWLLIAIYNLILTVFIIVPLSIALPPTDDNIFFIAGIGILFATSGVVFPVYLPKLLAQVKLHSESSKSPHTPGTGQTEPTIDSHKRTRRSSSLKQSDAVKHENNDNNNPPITESKTNRDRDQEQTQDQSQSCDRDRDQDQDQDKNTRLSSLSPKRTEDSQRNESKPKSSKKRTNKTENANKETTQNDKTKKKSSKETTTE
jgi:hypothetical protein